MRYLLDTHTFLWWVLDDSQLSPVCRQIIAEPANTIYFSAASAWEISIKARAGKLPLPETPMRYIPDRLHRNRFVALSISIEHTLQTYTLPLHHRDPFDRILVAQGQIEDLPILTADNLIKQYAVATLW